MRLALLLAVAVYVLSSGPTMWLPGARNEVYDTSRTKSPDGMVDAEWPIPFDTLFGPLAALEEVPVVGLPLTWYYRFFRPHPGGGRFESVRDALTHAAAVGRAPA